MEVKTNNPISSKIATIIEFLRIIVCLFIPNIVVEAKNTGAEREAYFI